MELASRKRRAQVLGRLNHCRDLDERFVTPLPATTDVVGLLREHGAPESCYVISCTNDIDGHEMKLADAVLQAEAGGWGTLIGCIPGRLAYYYDECGDRRMLLERKG